jgi:cell division protein FtsA
MEEILEFVYAEIYHSGYQNQLVGGIVLTGGGAQLQHMKQLAEHVTGMDARIGTPGEHLAKGLVEEVNHPIYATSVGLVIHTLDNAVSQEELAQASAPQVIQEKVESVAQPIAGTGRKPKGGLMDKVKSWFENQIQNNNSNFIE